MLTIIQGTTVRQDADGAHYAHCTDCGPITLAEHGDNGHRRMVDVAELHDLITHQGWDT